MTVDRNKTRSRLQSIGDAANESLGALHDAREIGISASRQAIQMASRAIRAAHRGDFVDSADLVKQAGKVLDAAVKQIDSQPSIRHSGFMLDGEKEYAEAAITLSFISGSELPTPSALGIGVPAYLNGLAEAASELRRSALDAIRAGDAERADNLLWLMDESMGILAALDFPEGVTGGLRRTTDQLRAVTERTRGDVTAALRQGDLEARMKKLERQLERRL